MCEGSASGETDLSSRAPVGRIDAGAATDAGAPEERRPIWFDRCLQATLAHMPHELTLHPHRCARTGNNRCTSPCRRRCMGGNGPFERGSARTQRRDPSARRGVSPDETACRETHEARGPDSDGGASRECRIASVRAPACRSRSPCHRPLLCCMLGQALSLDLDEARSTRPGWRDAVVVAQRRHVDAGAPERVQHRAALGQLESHSVDVQAKHVTVHADDAVRAPTPRVHGGLGLAVGLLRWKREQIVL